LLLRLLKELDLGLVIEFINLVINTSSFSNLNFAQASILFVLDVTISQFINHVLHVLNAREVLRLNFFLNLFENVFGALSEYLTTRA
jgi:hypothetical protein